MSDIVNLARELAKNAHKGQKRRNGDEIQR